VAVKLDPWQKLVALILMVLALGFGAYLAYKNYNGVGTAAVFAVALIMLIAGFGGVLPTSLKVGDVEVAIDQARRQGAAAVENVATASDPQAAAQRVKQQHPELASQVDGVKDAVQGAMAQGASMVASVPTAPDPQAAAQQIQQQHPDLAPHVERVKDALQAAMQEGASVVASVPTAPDPQAAAQQVQQEHPELAREAAAVAVVALTDPRTLREAAEKGILEEQLANVDPANIQPITSADVEVAIREARQHGDGSQVKS
jgi:hypothetical protein